MAPVVAVFVAFAFACFAIAVAACNPYNRPPGA